MDDLVKKAIQRSLIKKPSKGFTDEVMEQVFQLKTVQAYKPIISKTAWIILGLFVILALSTLAFVHPSQVEQTSSLNFINKFVDAIALPKFAQADVFSNLNLLLVSGISLAIFLLLFFDSYIIKKR